MSDDFDHSDRKPMYRSSHPSSFLTEEDIEEVERLDLPLGEYQAWMWNRGVGRMIKAIFSDSAHPKDTGGTAADQSKSPRINYHAWWRSEQVVKRKRRKTSKDAARYADRKAQELAWRDTKEGSAHAKVEHEAALRMRCLRAATKKAGGDKRLEQIRGQEKVYVKIWRTAAFACFKHGPEVSAAKIAQIYMESYKEEKITRHQIRSRLKVIRELEQPGGIWSTERLIKHLKSSETA